MVLKPTLAVMLALMAINALKAQTDTLLLRPERLGQEDIAAPPSRQDDRQKIISGSRFPIEAGDLPYSIYVITKEEIRQNGYETLVDALKMAPGIRVSQPGNAIEGETFLMRGLLGNTYAKILINDVPVKPVFVGGMPIGAQLPIKEAERIEVIYGAASALYGSDANAGVINIITRKSEKPVFMQADLNVGYGLYSSVNVMFGGRLGRERRAVNLFAYASNVLLERRDIFYDRDINYNPTEYFLLGGDDTSFVNLPNYAGTPTRPELTNTPHLSRKFGMSLNFRGITFSAEGMFRREHSAVGLNPLAASYSNPLTYTGEGILRMNLNFFKTKATRNRKTDITYVRYRFDDRSSALFVQNDLNRELRNFASYRATQLHADSASYYEPMLFRDALDRYLTGLRYFYGESNEVRIEHVRNYRILKSFSLTVGANLRGGWGVPLTALATRPVLENDVSYNIQNDSLSFGKDVFPVAPVYRGFGEFNGFGQLFYNGKKLNLIAGLNYSSNSDLPEAGYSPSLAGLLKLSERLRARASWGRSFRAPSAYYRAVSYTISTDTPNELPRDFAPFLPEKTTSLETGLRWYLSDNIRADITWFSNESSGLLRHGREVVNVTDALLETYLGYRNDTGFVAKVKGGQLHLRIFNLISNNRLEAQYNLTWSKTREDDRIGIPEQDKLPSYAGRINQLRLIARPLPRTTLILDGLWLLRADEQRVASGSDKVFTLDATARLAFNERFDVYVKVVNLFDTQYAGIRATGTLNDLAYNPQNGFFLRFGMNYFVE